MIIYIITRTPVIEWSNSGDIYICNTWFFRKWGISNNITSCGGKIILHYKFIIHPTFQGIICTTNTVGNDVIYGPISYLDFSQK